MAIWGPDAPVRDAAASDGVTAAPRPAERWIDILLVPLIASGLMALLLAIMALSGDRFRDRLDIDFLSSSALYAAMAGYYLLVIATVFTLLLMLLPEAMQQELTERSAALEPGTIGEAFILLLAVAVLAPLAEEIYFRGIMLRVFARHVSFAASAVLTAIFFALVHGHLFPVPGLSGLVLTGILFVIGILLALFARAGGSVRAPFAMHAAYNTTLMLPGIYALLVAQA